jgi:hypothetical protein
MVTELVATMVPDVDTVRSWNIMVSAPSVVESAATVTATDPELFAIATVPDVVPPVMSAAVILPNV